MLQHAKTNGKCNQLDSNLKVPVKVKLLNEQIKRLKTSKQQCMETERKTNFWKAKSQMYRSQLKADKRLTECQTVRKVKHVYHLTVKERQQQIEKGNAEKL